MSYPESVIQGVSGGFLIHGSFPQLFFEQDKSLDEHDTHDHHTEHHDRYLGPGLHQKVFLN